MSAEAAVMKYANLRIGQAWTQRPAPANDFTFAPSPAGKIAKYYTAESSIEAYSGTKGQAGYDIELVIRIYEAQVGTAGALLNVMTVSEQIRKRLEMPNAENLSSIFGFDIIGCVQQNSNSERIFSGPQTWAVNSSFYLIKIFTNGS